MLKKSLNRSFRVGADAFLRKAPCLGVRSSASPQASLGSNETVGTSFASFLRFWAVAASRNSSRAANSDTFRMLIEDIVAVIDKSPDMSSPVRLADLRLRWPSAGAELEARAAHNAGMPLFARQSVVYARTLIYYSYITIRDARGPLRADNLPAASSREYRFP